jgi:hypothetical protein
MAGAAAKACRLAKKIIPLLVSLTTTRAFADSQHVPSSDCASIERALSTSPGTALSFGRFLSVSFPHFLCLSKLFASWPVARAVLLASFIVLQCFLAKGLIGWHFVG